MSSDSLGHVVRDAHNTRASESFNRFFRRQPSNEPDAETSDRVALDAGALDAGAQSSPPPQPIDGNAILRNVLEEAAGAKQMGRRYGR